MIFFFIGYNVVKRRVLFLAGNIIVIDFVLAGKHAAWCLAQIFL